PAGIKVQPSAVKEDGRLQMIPIPEPIGVFFIVWIFELSPSLVALVIRWSKYVRTLSRCSRIIRATFTTGGNRECVAQKYQCLQCFRAQPLRRYSHKSRSDSLIAQARPVFRCRARNAANFSRDSSGRFSREYSHRYFVLLSVSSPCACSRRCSPLRT